MGSVLCLFCNVQVKTYSKKMVRGWGEGGVVGEGSIVGARVKGSVDNAA